jgi:hypothetical protein
MQNNLTGDTYVTPDQIPGARQSSKVGGMDVNWLPQGLTRIAEGASEIEVGPDQLSVQRANAKNQKPHQEFAAAGKNAAARAHRPQRTVSHQPTFAANATPAVQQYNSRRLGSRPGLRNAARVYKNSLTPSQVKKTGQKPELTPATKKRVSIGKVAGADLDKAMRIGRTAKRDYKLLKGIGKAIGIATPEGAAMTVASAVKSILAGPSAPSPSAGRRRGRLMTLDA